MPATDPADYTPHWNDTTESRWFDDPDKVVDFARWYFEGGRTHHSEVIDLFEKPWKWEPEYQDFLSSGGM